MAVGRLGARRKTIGADNFMDVITELLDALGSSNAKVLCILALNILGLVLKKTPRFPNGWIPLALMAAGALVFPFVAENPAVADPAIRNPLARLVLTGFLLGAFAWILHDKLLRKFEKFLPAGFFDEASGDDKNPTPPPTIMKMLQAILMAGSLILCGSGCNTVKPPAGPGTGDQVQTSPQPDATKIRRVATIARLAAFDGAMITIDSRPGDRAYFVASKSALDGLLRDQNYDPIAFREAIQKLPIKELKGPAGSILVNTAVEVFDELETETVSLDRSVWLLPVITAVRDGFAKALDQTGPPAPPTLPGK